MTYKFRAYQQHGFNSLTISVDEQLVMNKEASKGNRTFRSLMCASPEVTASHTPGDPSIAPPRTDTPAFPTEACQSNLGKGSVGWWGGPIKSPRKLGKLLGYFEKAPGPSQS